MLTYIINRYPNLNRLWVFWPLNDKLLYMAVNDGDVENVKKFLSPENLYLNVDVESLLHLAARKGYVDIVALLLKNNFKASRTSCHCKTALHMVLEAPHHQIEIALLLCLYDYKITTIPNAQGKRPIDLIDENHILYPVLSFRRHDRGLLAAIMFEDNEWARRWHQKEADTFLKFRGQNLLHIAASHLDAKNFKWLAYQIPSNLLERDESHFSVLHHICLGVYNLCNQYYLSQISEVTYERKLNDAFIMSQILLEMVPPILLLTCYQNETARNKLKQYKNNEFGLYLKDNINKITFFNSLRYEPLPPATQNSSSDDESSALLSRKKGYIII